MSQLRTHDPILQRQLLQYLQEGDATSMSRYLQELNVRQFRTAGYLLAQREGLASLPSDIFWKFFLTIVPTNSKAYLGTFLKAAALKKADGSLTTDFSVLSKFSATATIIDHRKILQAFLPLETDPRKVEKLLDTLSPATLEARITLLTSIENVACYYTLFKALKTYDATPAQLRRTCILLMRCQSTAAFRFAAILKAYFAVDELPGTFSLKIAPWQLSRLDASYENFRKVVGNV